jgi:hypothetical protein
VSPNLRIPGRSRPQPAGRARVGGAGEQLMFTGAGRPMKPMPIAAKDSQLATLRPLVAIAAQHEAWSLFDLRALRRRFRALDSPELEKVVFGFDLAVIVPRALPSHELDLH